MRHQGGLSLCTSYQPISGCGERDTSPPRARASNCPPKQTPSSGPGCQGAAHQFDLVGHPGAGQSLVVDRPARPQGHDDVVAARVREGHVEHRITGPVGGHDLESVDVETVFGEGLAEGSRRRGRIVVEEQDSAGHPIKVVA